MRCNLHSSFLREMFSSIQLLKSSQLLNEDFFVFTVNIKLKMLP